MEEKFYLIERDEERTIKAVENLGKQLGIETPYRIEAFDNSNIQGTNPVSAMIAFIDGKPAKKEYRKYKIKTVQGPDDYESMREVVRRRYTRALKEGLPLPDLIIIDGGKGHLAAASDVLENELGLYIPMAGLVKDDKHKTSHLIIGDPPEPVMLERNSQEFYLLQRVQDEVHRFAITFHRQLHGNLSFNQHWMIFTESVINGKGIVKTFWFIKEDERSFYRGICRSRYAEKCRRDDLYLFNR